MTMKLLAAGACVAMLALPLGAQAQGVPGGAVDGYDKGDHIAGPIGGIIGAAVGGVVGGVIGGVNGVLGVRPSADEAPPPRRRSRHNRRDRDDR